MLLWLGCVCAARCSVQFSKAFHLLKYLVSTVLHVLGNSLNSNQISVSQNAWVHIVFKSLTLGIPGV